MASPNNLNFPHQSPPPPLPPSPSDNDNNPTVIIIVFISFGCLVFFAGLAFALCCFFRKKAKKSKSEHVEEVGIVHVDEHKKVKEAIVNGPHGPKTVVLEMEDDIHIGEAMMIRKDEKIGEEDMKGKKSLGEDNSDIIIEMGKSSSHENHRVEHKA
ncbi:hypothetical protein ACFE04_025863 [Oxalis oulophora]